MFTLHIRSQITRMAFTRISVAYMNGHAVYTLNIGISRASWLHESPAPLIPFSIDLQIHLIKLVNAQS